MKTKFAFVFFFFAQVINIRLDEIVTSIVTARSLPARSRGREFQNEGGKTSRHETQCCGGVVVSFFAPRQNGAWYFQRCRQMAPSYLKQCKYVIAMVLSFFQECTASRWAGYVHYLHLENYSSRTRLQWNHTSATRPAMIIMSDNSLYEGSGLQLMIRWLRAYGKYTVCGTLLLSQLCSRAWLYKAEGESECINKHVTTLQGLLQQGFPIWLPLFASGWMRQPRCEGRNVYMRMTPTAVNSMRMTLAVVNSLDVPTMQ